MSKKIAPKWALVVIPDRKIWDPLKGKIYKILEGPDKQGLLRLDTRREEIAVYEDTWWTTKEVEILSTKPNKKRTRKCTSTSSR